MFALGTQKKQTTKNLMRTRQQSGKTTVISLNIYVRQSWGQ
jgi:hypothetical protein